MLEGINYFRLSEAQRRIWFTQMMYPGSTMFNIGGYGCIKGKIDVDLLKKSLYLFIDLHDIIKTRIFIQENEPYQYIDNQAFTNIDYYDFACENNPKENFSKWVNSEISKPIMINNTQLYTFSIYKISDVEFGYFVKMHHIIADGWSFQILAHSISGIYEKLKYDFEINEEVFSYVESILSEQEYLLSHKYQRDKQIVMSQFDPLPEYLPVISKELDGKRKTLFLSLNETEDIYDFCKNNNLSLNSLFIYLFIIYKQKVTGIQDIVLGNPLLGRSNKRERLTFGMFTNPSVLRYRVNETKSIMETIKEIDALFKKSLRLQRYPYNHLIKDLKLQQKGYQGLYEESVNYYGTKLTQTFDGNYFESFELYNGQQEYALQIIIRDWNSRGIQLDFDYKINRYQEEDIDALFEAMRNIIHITLNSTQLAVNRLCLMKDSEINKYIYDFNKTKVLLPETGTIIDLFKKQVLKYPDKTAVSCNNNKLTYWELDNKSDKLAFKLHNMGIGRNKIVGLFLKNSIDTVVGILGILKTSAAYVPIDTEYPLERIQFILGDAQISVLLTHSDISENYNSDNYDMFLIDQELDYCESSVMLKQDIQQDDLAYIIYTSGSMGKPKGTMIHHRGLLNYILFAVKSYTKTNNEIFPLYSSIAFDLTVTSLFTPIICGGMIRIYQNNETQYAIYQILKENKVTIIKLTPAHLSLVKEQNNSSSSIHTLIVGGDILTTQSAKDIYDSFEGKIAIYNEYGPTETTVGCMIHQYDIEKDNGISVPIGVPIDNMHIYILDHNNMPLQKHIVGELCISGYGVALGYWKQEELTKKVFVINPFDSDRLMYKTGDYARFINDSVIEYVGRRDQQIKINGYRIELGEVQNRLLQYENISDAVVINIGNVLCAFIIAKKAMDNNRIRKYLKEYLPEYMIPSIYIYIDYMPLTINGKIDNNKLIEQISLLETSNTIVTHSTEADNELLEVISKILGLPDIGMNHNFYYLGGDSIKALQIENELIRKGYKLKMQDIIMNPVIADMAGKVTKEYEDTKNELCEGIIHPTPIINWFLKQKLYNPNYYCQCVTLETNERILPNYVSMALNYLIYHHDILRLNYNSEMNTFYYNNNYLNNYINIDVYDLREMDKYKSAIYISETADRLCASFNIENKSLIHVCFFQAKQNVSYILIIAHHLVIDGVSWRLLLEDFDTLLDQAMKGYELSLQFKTNSYQEYSEIFNKYEIDAAEKTYWKEIINRSGILQYEFYRGPDIIDNCRNISYHLDRDTTDLLKTKANEAYRTKTNDLLIVALCIAITKYTNNRQLTIVLEGHGRDTFSSNLNFSRTIGWFTSIYPFSINLSDNGLNEQITQIKEELRKIPKNGFGYLAYSNMQKLDNDIQKNVKFNYLGEIDNKMQYHSFSLLNGYFNQKSAPLNNLNVCIDINAYIINGQLNISAFYNMNHFTKTSIIKLIEEYINEINTLIKYCVDNNSVQLIPSDFNNYINMDELKSLFE